jgi:hypothetical protein
MTDKIINFYDKLGLIKNSNLPKILEETPHL